MGNASIEERREAAGRLRACSGHGLLGLYSAVLGDDAKNRTAALYKRLADLIDSGEDVSVDAYDLLPKDECEALRWVHGHGGLHEVRRDYQDAYYRRSELCAALGIDMNSRWSDAMAEMMKRLMPPGFEWTDSFEDAVDFMGCAHDLLYTIDGDEHTSNEMLVEMVKRLMPEGMEWPRFEDGEPVTPGCEFADGLKNTRTCTSVELLACGDGTRDALIHWDEDDPDNSLLVCMDSGDRVKRPAPKVLDADGAEIRVGDTVYHVKDGSEMTVYGIEGEWLVVSVGGRVRHDIVTHCTPVLAADGKPLREGETVWFTTSGGKLRVDKIEHRPDGFWALELFADGSKRNSAPASVLTHQRPVLDADGVPIKVGDTVYDKDTGDRFEVGGFSYDCVVCTDIDACESDIEIFPSQLTHTKPEPPDSWERIEADLRKRYIEYWGCSGYGCSDCPSTVDGKRPMDLFDASCEEAMHQDIVRRCKALAERERSE